MGLLAHSNQVQIQFLSSLLKASEALFQNVFKSTLTIFIIMQQLIYVYV